MYHTFIPKLIFISKTLKMLPTVSNTFLLRHFKKQAEDFNGFGVDRLTLTILNLICMFCKMLEYFSEVKHSHHFST